MVKQEELLPRLLLWCRMLPHVIAKQLHRGGPSVLLLMDVYKATAAKLY